MKGNEYRPDINYQSTVGLRINNSLGIRRLNLLPEITYLHTSSMDSYRVPLDSRRFL